MDQHSLSFIYGGEVPSEGGIILYNVTVVRNLGTQFSSFLTSCPHNLQNRLA